MTRPWLWEIPPLWMRGVRSPWSALLDNDTDAEDDPLSIVAVGDAVNGTVSLDGTTIIYEHDGSETTTGSLSYSVSDGTDTVTAMVTH